MNYKEAIFFILRQKNKIFITSAVLIISASVFILNSGVNKTVGKIQKPEFDFKIISPSLPEKMNFAGEKVPLENFEVAERIDRELLVNIYWEASTILGIKRANRWFPVIEPILKQNNIPDDFKYVALIESNLLNTVSPAGAVGFWQITPDVAKRYGLIVNDQVDERYNVVKSTQAASEYFQDAYNKFKSWTLAAASYNLGIAGVIKQIERQKEHNYYNLLLGDETSRYIGRILAMKEILTHQEKYGYYIDKDQLYPELRTYQIKINSSVRNWADYAFEKGINYNILKYYNPWLRDTSLTDKDGKVYYLTMPEKGTDEPVKDN